MICSTCAPLTVVTVTPAEKPDAWLIFWARVCRVSLASMVMVEATPVKLVLTVNCSPARRAELATRVWAGIRLLAAPGRVEAATVCEREKSICPFGRPRASSTEEPEASTAIALGETLWSRPVYWFDQPLAPVVGSIWAAKPS